MSSRKKHDIGIKWVEYLTREEALGSKELKSVISLCNGTSLTCKFNDHKGGIGSRDFHEIFYMGEHYDPFSEDLTLTPVRIHYRNGGVGYGFKYWDWNKVVKRRNGKLRSFFIKDGYIDDATGELTYEISSDSVIPCNILKRLPFYNEKVRDNLKSDGYNVNSSMQISSILSSNNFFTYETKYSVPPNSKNDVKMPWVQVDISNMLNDKDEVYSPTKRTYCYSYLKSMYVDDLKIEYVYGIIPMSDLYTINRKVGWGVEDEIWNNIDNTITGNI